MAHFLSLSHTLSVYLAPSPPLPPRRNSIEVNNTPDTQPISGRTSRRPALSHHFFPSCISSLLALCHEAKNVDPARVSLLSSCRLFCCQSFLLVCLLAFSSVVPFALSVFAVFSSFVLCPLCPSVLPASRSVDPSVYLRCLPSLPA